ncbi:MFS transporter [Amycolatopsis sp. NPDC059657]|uniref:MFS transporter n=1 Tax=Amycolatopsis sp. NPDC059657 TaxID=3346899 RepID=UPI003670EABE
MTARVAGLVRGRETAVPRALLVQTFTYAIGTGMFMAGGAVFFTKYVGLSAVQVSLGFSLAWTASLLAKIPLGMLADRVGGRRAWQAAVMVQAVMFLTYPFVDGFVAFAVVVTVETLATSLGGSGRGKYIGDLFGAAERARTGAVLRSALNTGFAAGAGAAGLALAVDAKWAYLALPLVNAATFLVDAVLITWALPRVAPAGHATRPALLRSPALRDRRFLALALLTGIFYANGPLLEIVLPLWITHGTDAPQAVVAGVLMLNMVLTAVFQLPASKGSEDLPGAVRIQRRAGVVLAAACAVFAVATATTGWLTVAVVIAGICVHTAGELFVSAATWSIGYRLAPACQRATYLAVYGLGGQLAWAIVPGVATFLLTANGMLGWAVLGVVFLGGGIASAGMTYRAAATAEAREKTPCPT